MSDEIIMVNLNDEEIGKGEKMWVHRNDKLHRAFSVFVISGEKMLIQKRKLDKYHSGGLWANACCSHPRTGEILGDAVPRRMKEELGFSAEAEELFHFVYRAVFDNGITEYEFDHVFLCEYDGDIYPSEEEIDCVKWIEIGELKKDVLEHPQKYAAWFLIALPRLLEILEDKNHEK